MLAPTACRRMGSGTISLPSSGCFSPFPHGTGSLSVSYEYLALADGPAGFTQDYTCPALLRIPLSHRQASHKGLSPAAAHISICFCSLVHVLSRGPTTPGLPKQSRFGLFPGRSPLLGESLICFLFLRVLRCFSSPRLPPYMDDSPSDCRVFPFGHRGIKAYLQLPHAFRSLSRPSSPVRA